VHNCSNTKSRTDDARIPFSCIYWFKRSWAIW
jgi:hypothetical protein